MEPVVKDTGDGEERTDTNQNQHPDTDRTEGTDSAATPSPSVYAQETDLDVFDGYSFNGRHPVLIDDDDEDSSDLDDDEEGASAEVYPPSADPQRSETSSKSGKPPVPLKSPTLPRSSNQAGKRGEKSDIAALDRHLGGGIVELTEREGQDGWDFVEAGVDQERSRTKGTKLFAPGVVDRHKSPVFRESKPSRHGKHTVSGTSKTSGGEPVSPPPSKNQGRGRKLLSFRNWKNVSKTPPTSYSSRTRVTRKHTPTSSVNSSGAGASSTAPELVGSPRVVSRPLQASPTMMNTPRLLRIPQDTNVSRLSYLARGGNGRTRVPLLLLLFASAFSPALCS